MLLGEINSTNWNYIEIEFGHLILEIREGVFGQRSKMSKEQTIRRKTIVFNFGKMYCTEYIKNNLIQYYHYDLMDEHGNPIIKFHSEAHKHPNFQTETEPFHIHVCENENDLRAIKRLPNKKYQTLEDILIFIEMSQYTSPLYKK